VLDRLVSRTARVARAERFQVAVWMAVNIVLAIVFTLMLHVDDGAAHAMGF
jgi:hypothetical protein